MPPTRQMESLTQVADHLLQISDWFNSSAQENDLGVVLDPTLSSMRVRNALPLHAASLVNAYKSFRCTREQVAAAIEAIAYSTSRPRQPRLIITSQDGGSAGTALMLMFGAPVCFLLSGTRLAPLYMTANSHERLGLAKARIRSFLTLYGEIEIKVSSPSARPSGSASGSDEDEFDLLTYLDGLLDADRYPSGLGLNEELAGSATARRMTGSLARNLEDLSRRASERGHELFAILEDSLYSARPLSKSRQPHTTLVHRALKELDADLSLGAKQGLVIGVSPGMVSPMRPCSE